MRYIPVEFPCGCICERQFWNGKPTMVTHWCDAHWPHHEHDEERGGVATITCDCPACSFAEWAQTTPRDPLTYEGENWKFMARLKARREREAAR